MSIGYGEFIRAHRIKSGFKSQRKLAEVTSIANSTISRIEKEIHKPDVDTLKELAKYLTSTSLVELMIVCGYWDKEDLLEDLPESKEEILNYDDNAHKERARTIQQIFSSHSNINKNINNYYDILDTKSFVSEDEFIENIEPVSYTHLTLPTMAVV